MFPKAPVKLRDVFKSFQEIRGEAAKELNILVVGQKDSDQNKLVDILTTSLEEKKVFTFFEPEKDHRELKKVLKLTNLTLLVTTPVKIFEEFTIFLITLLSQAKKPFLLILTPKARLKESSKKDWQERLERVFGLSPSRIVFSPFEEGRLKELTRKILKELSSREVVLGKSLSLFREEAAKTVVKKASFENAFVSALTFLPGSDLPILTLNQLKMILKIAAIYGDELDFSRGRELLAVLTGSFSFRALARGLLNFLPSLGPLLKGAVAYGGTQAIGQLAISYFQNGLSHLSLQDFRR